MIKIIHLGKDELQRTVKNSRWNSGQVWGIYQLALSLMNW